MDEDIGNLERGKFADFSVMDISGIDPKYRLGDMVTDELASLLMYRGDGRAIESVYVAGQKLDVDAF
ncbi:MAG: hypothetical protein HN337_08725 [Deltaproteobacteria bacterium]|nr:hypothetical protein [Deltaproteobacteria bacterium]